MPAQRISPKKERNVSFRALLRPFYRFFRQKHRALLIERVRTNALPAVVFLAFGSRYSAALAYAHALSAFRVRHPKTTIVIIGRKEFVPFISRFALSDECIPFENEKDANARLASFAPSAIVDLSITPSAVASRLMRAYPQAARIAFKNAKQGAIAESARKRNPAAPLAMEYFALLKPFALVPSDAAPQFTTTAKEKETVDRFLKTNPSRDCDLIGIAAGKGQSGSSWPLARYKALMKTILADYAVSFVVIGAEDEAERLSALMHIPHTVRAAGNLGFFETAELVSRLNILITNDASPLHFAAFFGVPAVSFHSAAQSSLIPSHRNGVPYYALKGKTLSDIETKTAYRAFESLYRANAERRYNR